MVVDICGSKIILQPLRPHVNIEDIFKYSSDWYAIVDSSIICQNNSGGAWFCKDRSC